MCCTAFDEFRSLRMSAQFPHSLRCHRAKRLNGWVRAFARKFWGWRGQLTTFAHFECFCGGIWYRLAQHYNRRSILRYNDSPTLNSFVCGFSHLPFRKWPYHSSFEISDADCFRHVSEQIRNCHCVRIICRYTTVLLNGEFTLQSAEKWTVFTHVSVCVR